VLIYGELPIVRAGVSEQRARLERRRSDKRIANVARRETGCEVDRDSDFRFYRQSQMPGARPLFFWPNVGRRPPPSHALRVGRRWDIRAAPNTPSWPDQGPAGRRDPSSEPVLAAGCVFGILKCGCVDIRRAPHCTYGCFGALCAIRAPGSG
jgi:hypothetical protein